MNPEALYSVFQLEHEHRIKRIDRAHELVTETERSVTEPLRGSHRDDGVLLLTAAACGADTTGEPAATPTVAGTGTAVAVTHHPGQPVVVIRGNDYSFDDVPETIPVGSRVDLQSVSTTESHELVAFHLPDDETRSVTELVFLPREELDAVLGAHEMFRSGDDF